MKVTNTELSNKIENATFEIEDVDASDLLNQKGCIKVNLLVTLLFNGVEMSTYHMLRFFGCDFTGTDIGREIRVKVPIDWDEDGNVTEEEDEYESAFTGDDDEWTEQVIAHLKEHNEYELRLQSLKETIESGEGGWLDYCIERVNKAK